MRTGRTAPAWRYPPPFIVVRITAAFANRCNGRGKSISHERRGGTSAALQKVCQLVGAAEVKRQLILATLTECGGTKVAAAHMLGISLKTLYTRLQEYEGGSDGLHHTHVEEGRPAAEPR